MEKTTNESDQNKSKEDLISQEGGKNEDDDDKSLIADWYARNRSLVLRQTPIWAQSLTGIVISLGFITLIAGIAFRIDEVVTVKGQLESLDGSSDVETPAGGKVKEVYFKEGQLVNKGDLLMVFDTTIARQTSRTMRELIELEEKDLKSKQLILKEQEKVLVKKIDTNEKIVSSLRELVDRGGFQKVQYLKQLDQLFELESQLSNIRVEAQRYALDTAKSIGQMKNRLNEAELQLKYQYVKSPKKGIIFDPQAREDGVLNPGQRILTIIPQSGLLAKVYVPNKDIGFVKQGQKAKIRVDSFPFTRYGELTGQITTIGADALEPDENQPYYRFPIVISLDRSHLLTKGIKIPLRSGMAVTANLKLRDKRVISLFSDILVDQLDSVKTIRQQ